MTSAKPLRLLDLFSGIGGFSYAAEHLVGGFRTTQFVEREPFCQGILSHHWPHVPIHSDITTFTPPQHSADVVCGGFPCQDISTAGKQAGINEGTRSGLFYELMRVVRLVGPRFVVLENVAAILTNGLDTVLGQLAEAGFDAEWACIPASAVGACHQRDRWWLVAYPANVLSHGRATEYAGESAWRSQPKLGNGDWKNAAYPNNTRLERRQRSSLRQRAEQWPAWPRDTPALTPDWGAYLSQPVLRRGNDGLSNRVDRLKALGNAVVPQVAAIPLQRVKHLATQFMP